MPKKGKQKKRSFAEEQAAFNASLKRQKDAKAARAAGKPVPTAAQARTARASSTRQVIMKKVPATSGFRALQESLSKSKPKKKGY